MLTLHRAERTDVLAGVLAELLCSPLADPFATEVVAVPAKGVERWLTQRLSSALGAVDGDGVCAGVDFPHPDRLVADALARAVGLEADDDPWAPRHALWRLLEVMDDCLDEPWCAVLAAHLGHDGPAEGHRRGRRFATAAHVSELFRSYGAHRPAMLVDWAAGDDTDGAGVALPRDLRWQAELWRVLRRRLAAPSPAERLGDACARLRSEPELVDLPERVAVFGPTRLTTEQLAVLDALAAGRDVHLLLPHPSPAMWEALRGRELPARRRDDLSALQVTHPLLASLARDTRELQGRLATLGGSDVHHEGPPAEATLLAEVQAAVREDRTPSPGAPADGTIQVHACHGPSRQVEVLREALLHLFEQDPTLEPRDVLVMCPDVEAFAPLVRASFGQGEARGRHPGHRLRVRLADRSLRQTNPLLDTVAGLLELADGRVTASQVLDLARSAPVRRRFGLDDDDLDRLQSWTARSGARWGIGERQRAAYGLVEVPQNTWTTGLDRVLLGVTADEGVLGWLGNALPLDDVDSNDIDLAGRFAELVDRLSGALGRLQGPHSAGEWVAVLSRALDVLTDVSTTDAWQAAQARRELADATEHAGEAPLRLADVRALLAGRLAGRPTRANFRTGELTVCTMVPMRSVPHRVVALLGLDDEVFPRGGGVDGDDVLARSPCVGERDRRSEDRQLLLDAVLSAGERLLVLYTGTDPVSGQSRPPAVPLGELLDTVAVTAGAASAAQVVRRHPLQPSDPRDFAEPPFSFDEAALAGAVASVRTRAPAPELLPIPLPARTGDVALSDLVAFVVHPVKAFLTQRLGVRLPVGEDELSDALHAELDSLEKWDVGDRMLAARLRGTEVADFRQAEWRRGTLPPMRLGMQVLSEVEESVEALVEAARPLHAGAARSLDLTVDLGGGRALTGTVAGLHGEVLAGTSYSRLAAKHRLAAWVRLVALAAAHPGDWSAVTTGKGPYRRPVWRSTLRPPQDPMPVLRALVALRDAGLQRPLPMATEATATYATRRHGGSTGEEATEAAAKDFDSRFGDGADPHLGYAFGHAGGSAPTFARLLVEPFDHPDDSTRFGALACGLWMPLLQSEELGAP